MSAAWPRVVDRLLELCPTLPGWTTVALYDQLVVTQDAPGEAFSVGAVPGEDFGGTYEQTYEPGGLLTEAGTVRNELVVWSGDDDLRTKRTRLFALIDALQQAIFDDPTLGVLPQGSSATLSVDPQPVQNQGGSAQRAVVTVSYTALGL